ncbi:MAG: hypothetical protein EB015_14655 [Methylocystaceae bacterium]|nr:hypothetical protein [Methylocystaceae bacterium]
MKQECPLYCDSFWGYWPVRDAELCLGAAISLTNIDSQGKRGGGLIPLNNDLKAALVAWKDVCVSFASPFVIATERLPMTSFYAIVKYVCGLVSRDWL